MTTENIEIRHKSFLACPCCNKPIKVKFRFIDRDIYIEPVHSFKCSECGVEKDTMDVYSELDLDKPTKNARIVCRSCNNKLHHKTLGAWNRRGKQSQSFDAYVKNLLKKMKLED